MRHQIVSDSPNDTYQILLNKPNQLFVYNSETGIGVKNRLSFDKDKK